MEGKDSLPPRVCIGGGYLLADDMGIDEGAVYSYRGR